MLFRAWPTRFLLLLVLMPHAARAQTLASVDVIPPAPTANDSVEFVVHGEFPDSTYDFTGPPVVSIGQGTVTVTLTAEASGIGLPVITPFEEPVTIGPLSADTYQTTVHLQTLGTFPTLDTLMFSFTVLPAVPALSVPALGLLVLALVGTGLRRWRRHPPCAHVDAAGVDIQQ